MVHTVGSRMLWWGTEALSETHLHCDLAIVSHVATNMTRTETEGMKKGTLAFLAVVARTLLRRECNTDWLRTGFLTGREVPDCKADHFLSL